MSTTTKENPTGRASLRGAQTAEEVKQAAAVLGSKTSALKAKTSKANGAKAKPGPGLTKKPLEELACTCSAGMALEGHHWKCPRGQAIKRRQKEGTL